MIKIININHSHKPTNRHPSTTLTHLYFEFFSKVHEVLKQNLNPKVELGQLHYSNYLKEQLVEAKIPQNQK